MMRIGTARAAGPLFGLAANQRAFNRAIQPLFDPMVMRVAPIRW
jgi:hypothetical protein